MSFDVDEEILQDFLIEAGEILELLQEQLVALENNPDDSDLLNAIFRGFHTVKGGAGFLSLTPMVDVCHEAENTFDLLRTGKRTVNAELMDIILQAVDAINTMFSQTQQGIEQEPASDELLDKLKLLSSGAPLPSEMGGDDSTYVEAEEYVEEPVIEDDEPEPMVGHPVVEDEDIAQDNALKTALMKLTKLNLKHYSMHFMVKVKVQQLNQNPSLLQQKPLALMILPMTNLKPY